MPQLWYHRRAEQTTQVLSVIKSIDSFLFKREDFAKIVEKPSLLGPSIEKFRDYSGPCQTRAFLTISTTQSAPGQRGELCWTCSLMLCSSQACVCHIGSDRAQQQEIPSSCAQAAHLPTCSTCSLMCPTHTIQTPAFSKSCTVLTRH